MKKTNQPLADTAADRLVDYIRQNQLGAGNKLPNEYELASILKVGRSTVREAVRRLAARNILEVRQGSGTYISDKKGVADDPLGFSFVEDQRKLTKDLFEIRLLLEPRVAAMAAQYGTESQREELLSLAEAIEESYDSGTNRHIQLDVAFHSLLAKMSGNLAMDSLLPVINQSITLINDGHTSKSLREESRVLHRRIVSAVQEKNSPAAYDAMLRHIISVSTEFEK